jgi:aspartate oxidase
VFARRAVAHALAEPAPARRVGGEAELARLSELPAPPLGSAATRAALWRDAGIVRSAEGLSRLLDDPHPLARAIARCALARNESRGAHQRSDRPQRDPSLDGRHAVVRAHFDASAKRRPAGAEQIDWQAWT